MSGIYRTFSPRQLGIGILLLFIGLVCFAQLIFPSLSHKIYIIPLVAAPLFLLAGIWTAWQSFFTFFCKQCRTELTEKSAMISSLNEYNLTQCIQNYQSNTLEKVALVSKTVIPRLDVAMRYCPACVQIGMINVKRHEHRITDFIPWTVVQGPVVRALKEKLLF